MPGNVFSHSDVARTNPVNISKICLDRQHVSLQRLAVLVKFGELRDLRICSDKDVGISVRGRNMQPDECKATDDLGGIQAIIKEDPRVQRAVALTEVDPVIQTQNALHSDAVTLIIIGLLLQA